MWEVTYTIEPERGYFDPGEVLMWEYDIYLRWIHGIEFVSDGSVAIVYEVEGDIDLLAWGIDQDETRSIEYTIARESEPSVVKIRFFPDETLQRIFDIQRSFGVSMQFPLEYVGYDPVVVEITEVGSKEELRSRIQETREVAKVDVKQLRPYRSETESLFDELTDRQQEVLLAAVERGYYRCPRESTQADIAEELGCSASVVGQHLRRVESTLVSAAVPEAPSRDGVPRAGTE